MTQLQQRHWKCLLAMALVAIGIAATFTPWSAYGADSEESINFLMLSISLLGGLAIFLFGMEMMGDALKQVAGERMRDILGKLTTNRVMGMLTGLVVTAIIQSSSVTTVMLVGFVSAELMSLSQAVGVILGADIGTTVTAQIVAFKVTQYASALISIGFLMVFVGKKNKTKQYGFLIMGLGLIFFGMGEMSDSMKPLRSYEPFMNMMREVSHPLIGILVGALFTALIQSSSASMGVVIALAMQGLISLEAGIALAFGANIGTCMTAGLAAIGKPREAVRVAVAHVGFKVAGVALAAWFIPQLADLCRAISPSYPNLEGVNRLAAEVPRQVANAHTIFNVGMAALFLPIVGVFARLIETLVPDKPLTEVEGAVYKPKYLDDSLLKTPPLALSMVRREMSIMGDVLEKMIIEVPDAVLNGDMEKMAKIIKMDDTVDAIHEGITRYLSEVGKHNLGDETSDNVLAAMTAASELESIGDIIENNCSHLAQVASRQRIKVDAETLAEFHRYHGFVLNAFQSVVAALVSDSKEVAEHVMTMKNELTEMDTKWRAKQMEILRREGKSDFDSFSLLMDFRSNLKRIYYHTKRVAKVEAKAEDAAAWRSAIKDVA